MDIPFLILTAAAGLLLARRRALIATVALWVIAIVMVGWGPARSDGVHTDSIGFWAPWTIVLVIGLALVMGLSTLRTRSATRARRPGTGTGR